MECKTVVKYSLVIVVTVLSYAANSYSIEGDFSKILDIEKIKPKGVWYDTVVPDTLDLAERARLAINGNIGNIDPNKSCCVRFMFTWATNPPSFPIDHTFNLPAKNLRALPLLRTMCGSEQGLDIELATMRQHLIQLGRDGLVYYPFGGEGVPKDTAYPVQTGLTALAMLVWYDRDGNPDWLKYISTVSKGLEKLSISVEDRAYYPPESGMKSDGTWYFTTRAGAESVKFPYKPPEEPQMEQQGYEQCVKYEQHAQLWALVKNYQYNNDQNSLALAKKVVRFMLKPGMWEDTSKDGYAGYEHGIWAGHTHGNLRALQALMAFAVIENDQKLQQIVREGYDHLRRMGVIKLGWTPFWYLTEKYGRDEWWSKVCDGCQPGDLVILAIMLTDAGLGDYWDDVDYTVRNAMAEQQIIDLDKMRKISGVKVGSQGDKMLQQFLGGASAASLTALQPSPSMYGCCTPNNGMGMYYAWHGITRFDKGVATVNLFLNRASAWLDIESYLPYEGKVILKNKQCSSILVRIPSWLNNRKISCYVNDKKIEPSQIGNRLLLQGLKKKDQIRLEFDVPETIEKYVVAGQAYTVKFKGSTALDIQPKDTKQVKGWDNPQWWGLHTIYDRDYMKADKAPMHKVKRFVADKILPLQ